MKHWKSFVPVVIVLGVLGYAIWHLRSQAEEQAETAKAREAASAPAPAEPLSDRYNGNVGIPR